jgi:inorganic pyrophosphatase
VRDLTRLPNQLEPGRGLCRAIIETPMGHRGKYDFDQETGLFELVKILPAGMYFPFDFGFIPSTLCDDGNPLDVMVFGDEPSAVGTLLRVRLIGVLKAEQIVDGRSERNDRLLAVPTMGQLYAGVRTIEDFAPTFLESLSQFWINKAKLEGKIFRVLDTEGPLAAVAAVRQSANAARTGA